MANEKKNEVIGKEEIAKEKAENAADASEVTAAPNAADESEVMDASKEIVTDLKIERESFEYGGEERYDYFVRAEIAGKLLKAHLVSSDQNDIGAFEVFNAFYDLSDGKLQFRLSPWTRKAEKKGEEDKSGYTYILAAAFDPKAARIKVKPKAESDKAIIRALLSFSGFNIN